MQVLILVLVEIGLGGGQQTKSGLPLIPCLNPCFSGNRFGSIRRKIEYDNRDLSLNPCFSGNRFGSMSLRGIVAHISVFVLILVLVEIGLGAQVSVFEDEDAEVLILVLVEIGLGAMVLLLKE